MNKQPFYHQMEIRFTATEDLTTEINTPDFQEKLGRFLRRNLSKAVIAESTEIDAPEAHPGDPADLM